MKKVLAILGAAMAIATIVVLADPQLEIGSAPTRSTVPNSVYVTQVGGIVTNVGAWHFSLYPTAFPQIPYDALVFGMVSNQFGAGKLFYGIGYDTYYLTTYGFPSLGSTNAPFTAVLTNAILEGTVSGNVGFGGGASYVTVYTNSAPPTPVANAGIFWSSNTVLYWVTTTATNKVAGP